MSGSLASELIECCLATGLQPEDVVGLLDAESIVSAGTEQLAEVAEYVRQLEAQPQAAVPAEAVAAIGDLTRALESIVKTTIQLQRSARELNTPSLCALVEPPSRIAGDLAVRLRAVMQVEGLL